LAPTVGIATTGFCNPGGILQLSPSTKSKKIAAANSSQIASRRIIGGHLHRRPSTSTIREYIAILFVSGQKSAISQSARGKSPESAIRSKFQEESDKQPKEICILKNQSNILEGVLSREETNLEQRTTAIESN
jgi:hypothetical protein